MVGSSKDSCSTSIGFIIGYVDGTMSLLADCATGSKVAYWLPSLFSIGSSRCMPGSYIITVDTSYYSFNLFI